MDKVIVNSDGTWMTQDFAETLQKLEAIRSDTLAHLFVFGGITEEDRKKIYEKHDYPYAPYKERRKGSFFMAHVGENSKMLWKDEDGTVYDFTGYPDIDNINIEPYIGEWAYWRAVSGFDF